MPSRTTSTPPRRAPSCSSGSPRPIAASTRASPSASGDAVRPRPREPAGRGRGAPAAGGRAAPARPRGGPRGARLRHGRREAGRARGARLGGPRHPRGAAASAPAVIVYGRNPVREALRGRRRVERVWATPNAAREEWLSGVRVDPSDDAELERLCGSPDHQGICAQAEPYPYADPRSLLVAADALVLVLDQVQDPRNLGAICRVGESAGAAGVVIPERRSAEVTPVVCKASD